MSNYHVVVKVKGEKDWYCLFKDLTKSELKSKFISKYKHGKSCLVAGKVFETKNIQGLVIALTNKKHEDELKTLQASSRNEIDDINRDSPFFLISVGNGWEDYEIKDCGEDVTEQFISNGPGEGSFLTKVIRFINNPWLVTILGGLIVAIVVAIIL